MASKNSNLFTYRGNPNLKKPGAKFEWTPEMILEYAKCKNDVVYFGEHYYKAVTEEGLVNIKLRDYQKEMLKSMTDNRFTISNQSRQSGKALDLETDILTPKGFKKFKDIHVGDEIYSVDGNITKVTFETETMYNHKCYNINFSHGESIKADAEHIWTVETTSTNGLSKIQDITTENLKKLLEQKKKIGQSVRIKISEPLKFENKELSIDPYLFGLWIGDGTNHCGAITCHGNDLFEYKLFFDNKFPIAKETLDKRTDNVWRVSFKGLAIELDKLGILKNKHIPNSYIFNSIESRLALLQGLMDSDGSVTDKGSFEFYQKNIDIIKSVRLLLSTLGIKSNLRKKIVNEEIYYTLAFCTRTFDVFRLSRKLEKTKERTKTDAKKNHFFYLENIIECESVPVKCIQVDNPTHLFLCGNTLIPTHNTETFRVFLIHYILFNDYKSVGILANKADTANEILGKIQFSYQALPLWLQQAVLEFNKGSFVLENGSRIIAGSTSSDSIRGYTFQVIIIDEAAHIENWDGFYSSVFPTISAGKQTKLIMTSTPNGLNHFYEFWKASEEGKNDFHRIFVPWDMVPGRDEKWKLDTLRMINNNAEKFSQEYSCDFLGSSGTLIAGWKLKQLVGSQIEPILKTDNISLKMYEKPIKEFKLEKTIVPAHSYVIIADVSRGKGLDYSAFSVIDITKLPYKQVCVFRDNQIAPADYADVLYKTAKIYNEAMILTEINDIGEQVGYLLISEFGYENVLCTENSGKSGKKISFGGKKADKGIRTTKLVKGIGCSTLKLLVEQDKLLVVDEQTISEFTTFSRSKLSYAAEEGKHDDLVMGLVLFSWLTDQQYFKEYTDINTSASLREMTTERIENTLTPFGFIRDSLSPSPNSPFHQSLNLNLPFTDYTMDKEIGMKVVFDDCQWEVMEYRV